MTVTLRLIIENKGTFGIILFAEHEIDFIEIKRLLGKLKRICKIFVHKFVVVEQAFRKLEFELVERGINELVS